MSSTSPVWPGQPVVKGDGYRVDLPVVDEAEARRSLARLVERLTLSGPNDLRRMERAARYAATPEAQRHLEELDQAMQETPKEILDAAELAKRYNIPR